MIVLDTNVVSEPDKPMPDRNVLTWLDRIQDPAVYITSTTVAELAGGAERFLLRSGSSKYLDRLKRIIDVEFRRAHLPFDLAAAQASAVSGRGGSTGRPIDHMDAMIAAICLVHDATLATRNIRDSTGLT